MLIPGTEMHLVTFGFICIEVVILSYLCIHRFARRDDKTVLLDIYLCFFLLIYNITGGLLPDPRLPGSYFLQTCIAYATGFFTPCYFPYYVYKGLYLAKMRFHARIGVFMFLAVSYLAFVVIFAVENDLEAANKVLIIPTLYSVWVLFSVYRAIGYKYNNRLFSIEAKEELIVLALCLSPWLILPIITYFNLGQALEATVTNAGFLLLLALHVRRKVSQLRLEHERLLASEVQLKEWNSILQREVEKRTKEIERLNSEEKFRMNCIRFQLTSREAEIAFLIFMGETYKDVAERLFIAERTVAKHLQNIFYKIHVSNRVELCRKLSF